MRRFVALLTLTACVAAGVPNSFTSSAAARGVCPNPARDGVTIGKVGVGSTVVDVKSVNYPAGGQLDPPASPLNVGVSARHAPLSATVGSSILVWHINYSGCTGKLNVLMDKKKGFTFSVVDENGESKRYSITSVIRTPKGKYRPEWFRLDGPRQLVFVTCIGVVVNGHYKDNLVIIARPA